MSSDDEYKKLLATSTLIGLIGSLLLIVGMIFDIINVGVRILDLWILAWVIGILIVNLLTFLGSITRYGIVINDERPSLLITALFIFAPTILISQANTPMIYLLSFGNLSIEAGFMSYLGIAGMAILLISFFIQTWIFLWKNRLAFTRDTYFEGSTAVTQGGCHRRFHHPNILWLSGRAVRRFRLWSGSRAPVPVAIDAKRPMTRQAEVRIVRLLRSSRRSPQTVPESQYRGR